MRSALSKDTFRDIRKSLGRFISIVAIVAIGVAFFAGINVGSPDMKITADAYYDDTNFMDLQMIGTLGFTDEDVKKIRDVDGVEGVFPTYSLDVLTSLETQEVVLRVHGISLDTIEKKDEDFINKPVILEGRYPEKSGECVVDASKVSQYNIKIGSVIEVNSGTDKDINDSLKTNKFTVVGMVNSPTYVSLEKGSSSIGNGKVSGFIMIPNEDFNLEAYTEIFATVKGAKKLQTYSDKYEKVVNEVQDKLEGLGASRSKVRYEEVIKEATDKLENSKKELDAAKLEAGKLALVQGEEYKEAKLEAEKQIKDGEEKIAEAEKKIKDIKEPKVYVLDRNTNYSFVDYEGSADRVNAIAQVFPVFFFVVAALVCLTTMTRMVDEQRGNIGTLKALGYSKWSIASKYIFYAAFASITGSIIGLVIGFTIFPTVIFNAYGIMYDLPPVILTFNVKYAIMSTMASVLTTTLAALIACYRELIETPALLMRPKAPAEGKRILLERIPFIWNRFSFIKKVTARNIFRYKKRFFMTVIGISGCTALLLSGFGIKDSIKAIVDKQFGEIYKYDMILGLEENVDEENYKNIISSISKDERINKSMLVNSSNGKVSNNGVEKDVKFFIPNDTNDFNDFILLRERKSKEKLTLSEDGVIVSEKVAKQLDAKVGDTILMGNEDEEKISVRITGITEHYVSNYIYMTPTFYKNLYGEDVHYNNMICKISDTSTEAENSLAEDMINLENIISINFNSTIKNNFGDMIKSLNYVVLVMIVSAGSLAFVVLYNLTNVNISERLREIATIKVLGFYDNEVSAYVYRENFILTFIGMLCGLLLGVFLHRFIMGTAEIEAIMFGRNIAPSSYVWSAVLTLVFSVIVNMVMYYKLKNIPMVESLKSVD